MRTRSLLFSILCAAALSVFAQTITIEKPAYRSVYDLGLQCPVQVLWTLHRSDIGDIKRQPSWQFRADVPSSLAVARHSDWTHSGYQRGHLCPAADRSGSVDMMRQTFAISNTASQLLRVNVGSWKYTETQSRLMLREHDSVRVLVVPVFLPEDTLFISSHHIAVPHAFFKAVWCPENDSVLSAWFIFNR